MNERDNARLDELLADQSLLGLSDDEKDELAQLLSNTDVDTESFDRVTAMLSLASVARPRHDLPEDLKQKILAAFPGDPSSAWVSESKSALASSADLPAKPSKLTRREVVAWLMTAASLGWLFIDRVSLSSIVRPRRSLAELRDLMVRTEPDLIKVIWKTTNDPSARGVSGDVVWSNKSQTGFVRIQGLTMNEQYVHQYQLWIFDSKRDERYPIDGGTFNIESANSTSVIRMNPRLPIAEPTLFAVTIEKRGGVVVSTRERILLVAEVNSKTV